MSSSFPAGAAPIAPVPHEAILRDGASITIRRVAPTDRAAVIALFGRMSPTTVRHRFFAAKRELLAADLAYLTAPADGAQLALAAVARRGGDESLLGVGRYVVVDEPGARVAEIAFDVADPEQGRGIATLLLEHLARAARADGVVAFRAEVEMDDARGLEVFAHSGFAVREAFAAGTYRVEFPIAETEAFVRVAATRERVAAARSLRALFAPTSVAVIGASRERAGIGRAILDTIIGAGFTGPVVPIHPVATEIAGRPCAESLRALATPVDLAIIAVPAAAVEAVVRDCAAVGVRAAVVISAGFAEAGPAGAEVEHRLRALARASGMRLVGPNCMGVLSTAPATRLNATFYPGAPPAGHVAIATQSGALGLAMLDRACALELGIADFASIGNKADVSVNDLLSYWHEDPRTRVIALYLESFGNPRAFARLAPEVGRVRPIVAVKSGRSAAGTRAAASHSAALASLDVGIDALFAQTGVIRVDTLEQMFDVTALLASQPVPAGARVGVVTNAGGPGVLFADACEARGLTLPTLAPHTLAGLRACLPAAAGFGNPIDMIAGATPAQYEQALALVGNDPSVDAVVAIYVPPLVTEPQEIAGAIARGAGAVPPGKPVATVFMSASGTPTVLQGGPRGALPAYSFPENAAMALAAAARYGAWRARPVGKPFRLPEPQVQAVRARLRGWRAARPGASWLSFPECAALLAEIGVPLVAHHQTAPDEQAAVAAADELGYPVVLKASAAHLVHKSEAGGVVLDLRDAAAVRAAAGDLRARFAARGHALDGFLVQRQAARGVEAIVGVTTDPSLGPIVLAGLGGVAVEVYKDVAFRVTPVTDADARAMLDGLRGAPLLAGLRGAPATDRAALCDVIVRIAALVEIAPEIVELDLNPIVVLSAGQGAVAVDARIRVAARD